MPKYGFEIKLNNEILCRAGFDIDFYVLTCCLTSMKRQSDESNEISINVGGLDSVNKNHVNWIDKALKNGDKISIEIVTEKFEVPTTVMMQETDEVVLEQKIRYFYHLKEELKEHLKE